jgi:hypothetical protein
MLASSGTEQAAATARSKAKTKRPCISYIASACSGVGNSAIFACSRSPGKLAEGQTTRSVTSEAVVTATRVARVGSRRMDEARLVHRHMTVPSPVLAHVPPTLSRQPFVWLLAEAAFSTEKGPVAPQAPAVCLFGIKRKAKR